MNEPVEDTCVDIYVPMPPKKKFTIKARVKKIIYHRRRRNEI